MANEAAMAPDAAEAEPEDTEVVSTRVPAKVRRDLDLVSATNNVPRGNLLWTMSITEAVAKAKEIRAKLGIQDEP